MKFFFILSKIRTLASTAIPIEIINPAIPAAVNVTGMSLKSASIITTKIDKDNTANIPGKRYQSIKKSAIKINPKIAALTPEFTAFHLVLHQLFV